MWWTLTEIWDIWWSGLIKLKVDQLPPHSHSIYDYLNYPNGDSEVNIWYHKKLNK